MFGIKSGWGLKHSVVLMRILIGWHFLFEGIIKLYNPEWTSFGYLASAQGPLKSIFVSLANPSIIGTIDVLNISALIVVGLTLILGFYEKLGAFMGIGLLVMYYFAHPPFPGLPEINVEGNYWFVNKNLIELAALLVIYQLPTGKLFGLSRILNKSEANN